MYEPPLKRTSALRAGTTLAAFAWAAGFQPSCELQRLRRELEPAEAFGAKEASVLGLFGRGAPGQLGSPFPYHSSSAKTSFSRGRVGVGLNGLFMVAALLLRATALLRRISGPISLKTNVDHINRV